MKLLVCGSRSFDDYDFLAKTLDHLTSKLDKKKILVIHGGARGADNLAEKWCFERRIMQSIHHPEWKKGKQAGIVRNAEMIAMMEGKGCVVAFWSGTSPGTKSTIEMAKKAGIKTKVYLFKEKK
jgi:hypothetical protein